MSGGPTNWLARLMREVEQHLGAEMAGKEAAMLLRFHDECIAPLEQRVKELEERVAFLSMPLRYRLYYRFIRRPTVQRVLRWFVKEDHGDNAGGLGLERPEGSTGAAGSDGGVPAVEPAGGQVAAGLPAPATDNPA